MKRKRRLLERLAVEERLMELEHNRLALESLRLEVKTRKRREKMMRKILGRQNWKEYIA